MVNWTRTRPFANAEMRRSDARCFMGKRKDLKAKNGRTR